MGELALLDGKPRICTTKAITRCHFITMSKPDFQKALEEIDKKDTFNKVNFIKKVPLFAKLTRTYLGKLTRHFEFWDCSRDCVLFREGDIAEKVYIVKEGKFIVTKRIIHKSKQTENLQDILDDPQRACKLNNKFFSKNTVKKIDKHTIAEVGPYNLLGEEDVMERVNAPGDKKPHGKVGEVTNPNQVYKSSVKCISEKATLMVIKKADFLKLQQQSTTWSFLETMVDNKNSKVEQVIKFGNKAKK